MNLSSLKEMYKVFHLYLRIAYKSTQKSRLENAVIGMVSG
jgi:hypothetical protein